MGKRKGPKHRSPPKGSRSTKVSTSFPKMPPTDASLDSPTGSAAADLPATPKDLSTVQLDNKALTGLDPQSKPSDVPVIAIEADPDTTNEEQHETTTMTPVSKPVTPEIALADPEPTNEAETEKEEQVSENPGTVVPKTSVPNSTAVPENEADSKLPASPPKTTYCSTVKGTRQLKKNCDSYILPSGEACVKIPNSVIEKHRKSWDCFVIGQFYADPPSQGTIHNIVNGIWSKQYRDIAVSKMEGFTYLFRIPNVSTRNRVINQQLWQIDGKTMFVAKWESGVIPSKPELSEAPIWLELRQVPLQFFNEDGLERIASLVGDPKFLHPSTANKTNLEVAKVFTIIDPRKPLPEAVNVQFKAGKISRVLVSSPWMPPVCSHCKEIGHTSSKCKLAPITCIPCNSSSHGPLNCHKLKIKEGRGRKTRRAKPKEKQWSLVNSKHQDPPTQDTPSKLGTASDFVTGECSKSSLELQIQGDSSKPKGNKSEISSGVEPDSSDIESSEEEEGEILEDDEEDYRLVHKKKFGKFHDPQGKGPTKA